MVVDNQKFFHAVPVQDFAGFIQRRADRDGDKVLAGHHVGNRKIETILEAQIAVGKDSHQLAVFRDRNAGDAIALHQRESVEDFFLGRDGNGVDNHAAFTAFDAIDLLRLAVNGNATMNKTDAALLGKRNRQVRLSNRIHSRAEDRNIERDFAGKTGPGVGLARENLTTCRDKQNVVEGEPFRDRIRDHVVLPV